MRNTIAGLFLLLPLHAFNPILAVCNNSVQEGATSSSDHEGILAKVDSVSVEEMSAHSYAVVNGNYPDACTKISNVEQVVEASSFNITLYTEAPADLMCAQMITPLRSTSC